MSYVLLDVGLLLLVVFADAAHAELVFRCPSCSAERQAECRGLIAESCVEIVREPGCGCCPVCARRAGELCGVYTPRCASGLRCYPEPDSELPLEQLVRGLGRCALKADGEPSTGSAELSGEMLEGPVVEQTEVPPIRRPTKDSQWMGPKESAVIHHRQQMKTKMKYKAEEPKVPRSKLPLSTMLKDPEVVDVLIDDILVYGANFVFAPALAPLMFPWGASPQHLAFRGGCCPTFSLAEESSGQDFWILGFFLLSGPRSALALVRDVLPPAGISWKTSPHFSSLEDGTSNIWLPPSRPLGSSRHQRDKDHRSVRSFVGGRRLA
ncbi:hypothetical protein QTP86_019797 [Hemibagrus guttatus]|nr:hypothetical protein QTP86_019797 [Hemibagrus guttatus]